MLSGMKRAVSLIFSLIFTLSSAFSFGTATKGAELGTQLSYPFSDGVSMCQGVALDEDYFYFSGCVKYLNYNALVKVKRQNGEIVAKNEMCLPKEIIAKGYSHLGDCCVYDGKIYAACEAFFFKNPAIMIFDAETLQFVEYHALPPQGMGNGHFPWLCIENDVIYYTQAREVDEVRMLSLSDFSYLGSIKLNKTLSQITGGDMFNGSLLLNSNDGGKNKTIYSVDLPSGEVEEKIERETGKIVESEGMAVDGNELFCIDSISLVKVTLSEYKIK